jgi:MtN3 and saliva related transmembrane protein
MIEMISLIGYAGGTILGIQLIPQIHKVIKNKKADDISKTFIALNFTGLSLMSIYGILDSNPPIYIPTIISGINTGVLFVAVFIVQKTSSSADRDAV